MAWTIPLEVTKPWLFEVEIKGCLKIPVEAEIANEAQVKGEIACLVAFTVKVDVKGKACSEEEVILEVSSEVKVHLRVQIKVAFTVDWKISIQGKDTQLG